MKIAIAFIIAIGIGVISRWARIPSLAPQAIVGALLIVAMTAGYTAADQCLAARASIRATPISAGHRGAPVALPTNDGNRDLRRPAIDEAAASDRSWRPQVESLRSLVADLLVTNERLRQELSDRELHSGRDRERPAGTLEGSEK